MSTVPKTRQHLHVHASRRLKERFGLDWSTARITELDRRIQRGEGIFLARQSHTRNLWQLNAEGVDLYAIYNRKLHAISTFLTREMVLETFPGVLEAVPETVVDQLHDEPTKKPVKVWDLPDEWYREPVTNAKSAG